jgi:hypothetical protein
MCWLLAPVSIVNKASFLFLFLSLWPFTELLKKTSQALSSLYYLDVYGEMIHLNKYTYIYIYIYIYKKTEYCCCPE